MYALMHVHTRLNKYRAAAEKSAAGELEGQDQGEPGEEQSQEAAALPCCRGSCHIRIA